MEQSFVSQVVVPFTVVCSTNIYSNLFSNTILLTFKPKFHSYMGYRFTKTFYYEKLKEP